MLPRYSLRKTLYREAMKEGQVGMSGATGQKILKAGEELFSNGGNEVNESGVRVGQRFTHPAASATSSIAGKGNELPSSYDPLFRSANSIGGGGLLE